MVNFNTLRHKITTKQQHIAVNYVDELVLHQPCSDFTGMRTPILFALISLFFSTQLLAQPANDDCEIATLLPDVKGYCSPVAGYTNVRSTPSKWAPFCFPKNADINDVWFSFVAEENAVNVSVVGNTRINAGGTLANPQIAVWEPIFGDCDTLKEIGCISDATGQNATQMFVFNLIPGQTYYIQVSARFGNVGTFQLCVNNFNQVPENKSDCPTATLLCNKAAFTVPKIAGTGSLVNEVESDACDVIACNLVESSSAWYKWTCEQSGTLTFSITPLNPADDIDFIVYEIPNINSCNKTPVRCGFAGENVGRPLAEWIACTGATGLRAGESDNSEACGCAANRNNFLRPLDMVAGRSYALMIMNFSESGSGFTVTFGGTGTFLGPKADFTVQPNRICYGETITLRDNSIAQAGIKNWNWSFGVGATPVKAATNGPHNVSWGTPGIKRVLLQIESNDGCIVTHTDTVVVDSCCTTRNAITANGNTINVACPGEATGAINLFVNSQAPAHTYKWTGPGIPNAVTEDLSQLRPGTYTVTVTNKATCQKILQFSITEPPPFAFTPLVRKPTCAGGQDGEITLLVDGGTPQYAYNWGSGYQSNNRLSNLVVGDYSVIVQDANGCLNPLTIEVRELELLLSTTNVVTPPLCFDSFDGRITLQIANGLGPYQFNFGNGFTNSNVLPGLNAGTYNVVYVDANGCRGDTTIQVIPPDPVTAALTTDDINCFGENNGEARVLASGGAGGFAYTWSQSGVGTGASVSGLLPGIISVTVVDANGCDTVVSGNILEPTVLVGLIDSLVNNLCYGEAEGKIAISGSGGTAPYTYSFDGIFYGPDQIFDRLPAGQYTLFVKDARGCITPIDSFITQPGQLIVDIGRDTAIELGYSVVYDPVVIPFNRPVTFAWSPSDNSLECLVADCSRISVMPVKTTLYNLVVTDEDGCTATDAVLVEILLRRPVFVPRAFSPNGDGQNDFVTVYGGPGVRKIRTFQIFDRWGAQVYEGNNFLPNQEIMGWNGIFKGQFANPGVFTWIADVEFIDDSTAIFEGDVTLLR